MQDNAPVQRPGVCTRAPDFASVPGWARAQIETLDRLDSCRAQLDHLLGGNVALDAETIDDVRELLYVARTWAAIAGQLLDGRCYCARADEVGR